jgi:DNA-binding beta-propeller fold protein YncE
MASSIRIIGSGIEGRTDNHFAQPRGICVDETSKELFVVDCNNHRICVFSVVTLTFLRQIGRGLQGTSSNCLNYAVGACLDVQNEKIYVADTNNHRISAFNKVTGAHLQSIGSFGSGYGLLASPYGRFQR